VTLTGDDIKTSATDETSISAALSNKVTVNNGTAYDLDTATNPGGYTWYDSQNLMGAGTGALFDLHVLA
ncbi:hypothetical protein, partial [Pseudoflavonifractor phocaeensis]|uniref:hypothetical protein n=1 Tax=Pseudoflavonifractor phocaeensis TaxID=1870988 RepID=UPI00195C08BA